LKEEVQNFWIFFSNFKINPDETTTHAGSSHLTSSRYDYYKKDEDWPLNLYDLWGVLYTSFSLEFGKDESRSYIQQDRGKATLSTSTCLGNHEDCHRAPSTFHVPGGMVQEQ
jgi:hypothetical protein